MDNRYDIWKQEEYTYEAAYGFMPNIRAFLHRDSRKRECMIVVPGGGYCMCVPSEAGIIKDEFYYRGMNVFVLTYTTDITMSVPLKKQPLNDISRAVRFIRSRADEFNILSDRIVICGFSAGGHLCSLLATHFAEIEDPDPAYREFSNRPDAAVLCYPVITAGEYTHIYSIQALAGKEPSPSDIEFFSSEKNVTSDTTPCFIWQTREDSLVPVKNSYLMAEALLQKGVPYAHYVFPNGDHGLSLPTENFFRATEDFISGEFGDDYTMEQVKLAVDAVLAGNGVDVSEERREELRIQFSGEEQTPPAFDEDPSVLVKKFSDIAMWPRLLRIWLDGLFEG